MPDILKCRHHQYRVQNISVMLNFIAIAKICPRLEFTENPLNNSRIESRTSSSWSCLHRPQPLIWADLPQSLQTHRTDLASHCCRRLCLLKNRMEELRVIREIQGKQAAREHDKLGSTLTHRSKAIDVENFQFKKIRFTVPVGNSIININRIFVYASFVQTTNFRG